MMNRNPFGAFRRHAIAALVALTAFPAMARADYLLDAGDVLEIAVFGMADFRRRVTVNVDGNVSVPFLGEVSASGKSLTELRQALAQGLDANGNIRSPDVTIELIEYRPFYISGDVSRPGAQPYRPRLTVRMAVALAGGYDALRFRSENPLLAAPEMQSQYDSLWAELVKQQARTTRIQAEIEGKDQLDLKALNDAPIPPRVIQDVVSLETRDLRIRLADFQKEKEFMDRSLEQAKITVAGLEKSLRDQEAGVAQQMQSSERASTNAAKGVISAVRVDEERRALITVRSQQIDTAARLTQARREYEDLARRRERLVDERQSRLTQELKDAGVELEKVRNQIRSAGERLLYTGAVKAQMRRGGVGPEVVIYRKADGRQETIPANEDMEVLPGDVIDVLIRPDQMVVAPGKS